MCMIPAKSKYADLARVPHTYYLCAWYLTENKEVPDRNIGVPPVRELSHPECDT